MKDLILLRGLPGAGKTTIADLIMQSGAEAISTDEYWDEHNHGEFDPDQLDAAHEWTESAVALWMEQSANTIVVHNTFTQPWEWEEYEQLAEEYGYRLHTLIVENRHGGKSNSDVPQRTIDDMESRFQIRLQ